MPNNKELAEGAARRVFAREADPYYRAVTKERAADAVRYLLEQFPDPDDRLRSVIETIDELSEIHAKAVAAIEENAGDLDGGWPKRFPSLDVTLSVLSCGQQALERICYVSPNHRSQVADSIHRATLSDIDPDALYRVFRIRKEEEPQ